MQLPRQISPRSRAARAGSVTAWRAALAAVVLLTLPIATLACGEIDLAFSVPTDGGGDGDAGEGLDAGDDGGGDADEGEGGEAGGECDGACPDAGSAEDDGGADADDDGSDARAEAGFDARAPEGGAD